jgi:hypothetical protein
VTHRLRVDPRKSMKAVTAEVADLLDGMDEEQRRSSALLASELIAQVAASSPDWNRQPIVLDIRVRGDAVRFEAEGPAPPAIERVAGNGVATDDPIADWGSYLIERLADRWGVAVGERRTIWAEISSPA